MESDGAGLPPVKFAQTEIVFLQYSVLTKVTTGAAKQKKSFKPIAV
jgi:hypothetical protein